MPSYSSTASSIHSRLWISRWLVGSSKMSRLILLSMSMHSRSRDCSPPDRADTGLNTSSPRNLKEASRFRAVWAVQSRS